LKSAGRPNACEIATFTARTSSGTACPGEVADTMAAVISVNCPPLAAAMPWSCVRSVAVSGAIAMT
jgi:hypothetical protein